jgi:hypothetical protein
MGIMGRRPFFEVVFAGLAAASRLWQWDGMAVVPPAQGPSIATDQFLALSTRLLGHRDLDARLARTYLDALVAVPATAALLDGLVNVSERTADHAALERDIIETWYTGVHQVNGVRQVATHSGALVWRVLGRPAPGSCAGAAGDWAQPPSEHP